MATTTTCIVQSQSPQIDGRIQAIYLITFYDGSTTLIHRLEPTGTDPEAVCPTLIPGADSDRVSHEIQDLESSMASVSNMTDAWNIQPAFPEDAETDSNAPTLPEARKRNFHRVLIRRVYPEDFEANRQRFYYIWLGIEQVSGMNVAGRRTWLQLSVGDYNPVSSRYGSMGGAISIIESDTPAELPEVV